MDQGTETGTKTGSAARGKAVGRDATEDDARGERESETAALHGPRLGFRLTAREFDLLEFVLDQKFASLDALYLRFFQTAESRSERYAAERVQLLRRHGFLRAERVYTRPELFYLVTPLAREVLQAQRPARRVLDAILSIDHRTFEHDHRVTLCRAHRERSGHAREWVSERRLKAEWAIFSGRLAREYCPDAVYTNRRGERVAFELELAPKTRDRLARKISRFLDVMRDGAGPFQRTLFVACEVATARTLEAMTRPYSEHFRVMAYESVLAAEAPIQSAPADSGLTARS